MPQIQSDVTVNLQVLSPQDADLYRAIFGAQAKGDWKTADQDSALLSERRLFGHVLADRYRRRAATSGELQSWLLSYGSLPEAGQIYRLAQKASAGQGVNLTKPAASGLWAGAGYGGPLGFWTEDGDHAFRSVWVSGIKAWKQGDASKASLIFSRLAIQKGLSSWDRAAAAFWAYRSLKRSGDTEDAYYWLRQAGDQPHSFYGMIANNLLGRDAAWSWRLPQFGETQKKVLISYASGWRALALMQIGKPDLAEAELHNLNPQGRRDVQDAMVALADLAHMPSLALKLGAIAVNDNGKFYDAALYPLPEWRPTEGFQVDRALLFAVMRHESQFDPMAISDRGACGLMQLMPSTARSVSGEGASIGTCSGRLLDPTINLALGQGYVKSLAAQPNIGDNLLLLLAAYNGGPNRAAHWLNETTQHDPLLFIESLPVRQTRDYVQQVLMHYVIYRARLGQPASALAQLARGEWPSFALRDDIMDTQRDAVSDVKLASNDGR